MVKFFFGLGALLAGFAVAAGAYGAHGGESVLNAEQARWVAKAARYQMYHAFALLAVAWAGSQWPAQTLLLQISGALFLAGILCFCGSLYLMAFSGINAGYVTPLGGVSLMLGWLLLAVAAWR